MARIRTIKPEFWTDEQIVECSMIARLLFIGMWNFCDDNGNLDRSSKQIKARVFPLDNIDCESMIKELIKHKLVIEYQANEKIYLHIKGFTKHQIINRKSKSVCPEFQNPITTQELSSTTHDNSVSSHADLDDTHEISMSTHENFGALTTEGKGREGKGKEGKEEKNLQKRKIDDPVEGSNPQSIDCSVLCSQSSFDEFWDSYPKKVGKDAARKAWSRIKQPHTLLHKILNSLSWQRNSEQWTKDNGQFIPNPATYLNQGRWQDEKPPDLHPTLQKLSPQSRKNVEVAKRWINSS